MTDSSELPREQEIVLDIEGMTCASCVTKVEKALGRVSGVHEAGVNLATRTATVLTADPELPPLVEAVRSAGYGAHEHSDAIEPGAEARGYLRRLWVAAALTIPILILTFATPDIPGVGYVVWALSTPVVFWAGWPFFGSALRSARHGATTMDTLIALGSAAAYVYSAVEVVAGSEELYFDTAAVIITLILVGKVLEARARAGANDAARALLERGARRRPSSWTAASSRSRSTSCWWARSSWSVRARRSPRTAWSGRGPPGSTFRF